MKQVFIHAPRQLGHYARQVARVQVMRAWFYGYTVATDSSIIRDMCNAEGVPVVLVQKRIYGRSTRALYDSQLVVDIRHATDMSSPAARLGKRLGIRVVTKDAGVQRHS